MSEYEDIIVDKRDSITVIMINREERQNRMRVETALELATALRAFRADISSPAAVLTGAGDTYFCIGGEHTEQEAIDYSDVMPVVDVYELIDAIAKPIIAAVNGFSVGGGNVLQTVCDLSIAAEHAIFRQVGPMVGSFDAGFGTWYLEDTIGRKRAKEMWYLNRKYTARQALEMGLVNEVVPTGMALPRALEVAGEIADRGPGALAGLKAAFSARHTGVVGQARIAHDLLLTRYRTSREAAEVSKAFEERRPPDRGEFHH